MPYDRERDFTPHWGARTNVNGIYCGKVTHVESVQLKKIAPVLILASLSGCGLVCEPDALEVQKAAMSQLNPIALSIQDQTTSNGYPPANLDAALGQPLPAILQDGGRLERAGPEPTASYILIIPNKNEKIGVTYLASDGFPDLSFGFSSRCALVSCSWNVKKSKWTCIRR